MIYPQNFEQKIGFDQIRQLLKGRCLSTLGEERVDNMAFGTHYTDINQQLDLTCELLSILQGKLKADATAELESAKRMIEEKLVRTED